MTDARLKLHFVRLYLGEHRMDVALHDSDQPRIVKYSWLSAGLSDVPPADWYTAVVGEVQFQRAQELKARTGRLIPME